MKQKNSLLKSALLAASNFYAPIGANVTIEEGIIR